MATTVDTLLVRIESDMAGLRKDLKAIESRTGQTSKAFANLGRIATAAFAGFGVAQVIGTIRTFEDLQATLKAVTGSAELAADSFELIRKFTATTTFQLEEVSGAFITLVNAGIAPTSDALQDIGNIAAARGKDIRDVAQAVFNATTGEMEMLKQLGIVARLDGEKINVTYKEVTETIDRSGSSIVEYIRNLSQAEFPTAIAERSATLSGAVSNLQDNISEFFMAVGDAGFKAALTDFTVFLRDAFANGKPLAELIGKVLGKAIRTLGFVLEVVIDNLRSLTVAMTAFLAVTAGAKILTLAAGFVTLAKTIRSAGAATVLLNNTMKKSVFGIFAAGLAYLAAESKMLDEVMDQVAERFGLVNEEGKNLDDTIDSLNQRIEAGLGGKGGPNTQPFEKAISKVKKEVLDLEHQVAGTDEKLAKVFADLGITRDAGNNLVFPEGTAEKVGDLKKEYEKLARAQKILDERDTAKDFLNQKTEAQELQETLAALQAQVGNNAFDQEKLKDAINGVSREIELQDPMLASLVSGFEQAGDTIANSLANAFTSGELSLKGFGDLVRQTINQVIANFLKLQLINPIINSAFGLGGTSFELKTAGNSAGGGQMHPSAPRLVGERGPELFVPHSAGTLLNNMNTKNAMSGSGSVVVNQSVNFATGVQSTVRAEVLNLMPQIQNVTLKAVREAKLRGGSFANAFGG